MHRDIPKAVVIGAITTFASFWVGAQVLRWGVDALGFRGVTDVAALPLREPAALPALLWAGIAGASIPTLLFLLGIRSIGPTKTSIVALVEPVFGALLAALLLAEGLGLVQVGGGILVLAAAGLLQRGGEDAEPHEAASGAA